MNRLIRRLLGLGDATDDVASYVRRLSEVVRDQKTQLDRLQEEHEKLFLQFKSFRGRVYAWRKWGEPETPPENAPKPPPPVSELPLSDPRVPIAQVKARLLKPGKPYNHN